MELSQVLGDAYKNREFLPKWKIILTGSSKIFKKTHSLIINDICYLRFEDDTHTEEKSRNFKKK